MKIRTVCRCCLLLVLGAIAFAPLVFGQDVLKKDPFVKGKKAEADPFGGGGGSGMDDGDPFGGGGAGDDENPFGDEVGERKPSAIREPVALLEYIQVDLAIANGLVTKFGTLRDVAPLREELGAMLESGEAELVETCFLRSGFGQRMKIESVLEYLYPVEFDTTSGPQTFAGKSATKPMAAASPTAFSIGSVGLTVEMEMNAVGGEGWGIDVEIAAQFVRNLGDRAMGTERTPELGGQWQPDFAIMELNSAVHIDEGATGLLGVLRPMPDEGKRVLALLKIGGLEPEMPEAQVEKGEEGWRSIVTQYEYIQLGHLEANELMRREFGKRDAGKLRASLAEMIEAGDAELVESVYFKASAGDRRISNSRREHIYPTQFDPPELPGNLTIEDAVVRPTAATPTAFKSRMIGAMIEQEVNVYAFEKVISLNFSTSIVDYLGDRKLAEEVPVELDAVVMPDFYSMNLDSNVRLFEGQYNLLGSFTPSGDPEKRVLMLVKAKYLK